MNTKIKLFHIFSLAILLMLLSFNAFAQKEVKGVVIDKYGFPIEGVKVSSGNEIVYTNDDGTFSINSSMDYLRFEKASFLAITKPTKALLEVVMNEDPLTKEVELPYNKKDVLELTSSVSTLNSCDIVDQYVSSIGSLLAGKLPGLTVLQSTDEPGNSIPKFYLRGRGSWNVASPRIYIDGFESSMDYLNVSEIETISILKDAAALAQFGIKGADGVIYITTKRGQIGKPKVNVNFHQGFQTPISLPKSIDSYTYASLYNEAYSNDRGEWMPYYNDKQLAAYKNGNDGSPYFDQLFPNVDWYTELLKPFAPTTDVDVNVTGGSKSVQYYVSLGYQNVDGLYDGTDSKRKTSSNANFQKINYRANIDAQISEIFFTKVSLGGDITDKYRPNTSINNLWKNMHFYPANAYPINTIDGYGGSAVYPKNLKAEILETGFYQEHCRSIQANLTLGQNLDFITKGLKLTETVSLYNRQGQHTLKSKTYQTYSPYLDEEGNLHYSVLGTQDNNFSFSDSGTSRNNIENRFNTEVSLSYNRLFNKHLVSGVLSFHNDKYTIEGTRLPMLTRGFSGQIDYGFDNRIFVDFSFAANGMSIYPSKNNLGFFPAVSLAWVISNEAFMSKHSWIDLLKVRASTGLLGMADYQTAANYYMYQQYYVDSNIGPKFGSEANKSVKGLHEYYIANPSASWEKLYRSNIGLDAMFANKTISLNVDAFYDYRYDILTKATLPSYYGMNLDKNINAGKVRNYGVEIALSYTNNIGDFNYSISPNFSFSRNKIKYMAENPKLYDYQYLTGHSIGTMAVLQSTGFYQSIEQITNSPQSTYDKVVPGDLVYTDLNNDGYINDNDYCYDDSYFNNIPEIYYGINVDLEYKGIDFHVDGYGMANRTLDLKNDLNTSFVDGIGNASVTSFNRWAYYPDQGIDTRSTATYPRLSLGANRHNLENSTFWLKSGNMFRISNISLGYTFPRRLSSIINVDKIRLYVSLVNPICFDGIEIGDPEWQSGGYPLMKTYKVGLNINF